MLKLIGKKNKIVALFKTADTAIELGFISAGVSGGLLEYFSREMKDKAMTIQRIITVINSELAAHGLSDMVVDADLNTPATGDIMQTCINNGVWQAHHSNGEVSNLGRVHADFYANHAGNPDLLNTHNGTETPPVETKESLLIKDAPETDSKVMLAGIQSIPLPFITDKNFLSIFSNIVEDGRFIELRLTRQTGTVAYMFGGKKFKRSVQRITANTPSQMADRYMLMVKGIINCEVKHLDYLKRTLFDYFVEINKSYQKVFYGKGPFSDVTDVVDKKFQYKAELTEEDKLSLLRRKNAVDVPSVEGISLMRDTKEGKRIYRWVYTSSTNVVSKTRLDTSMLDREILSTVNRYIFSRGLPETAKTTEWLVSVLTAYVKAVMEIDK